MLVRTLRAALFSTTLAVGGLVVAATPSHAEGGSCTTATPMTGNVSNSVGYGDTTDYWSHGATTGTYRVTVTSTLTSTNLYVHDASCGQTLCYGSGSGTTETCDVSTTTPATLKIRVVNTQSGTATDNYTMSVEWRSQPRLGTQCADGVDNDGDGFADSTDTGCAGLLDTSEGTPEQCPSNAGLVTCLSLTPGDELTRVNLYGPEVTSVTIVGSVDLYQFTLPNSTKVNLPCVVLDGRANACAALGGTFFARMVTIAPQSVPSVDPLLAEPLASVGLCEATLRATLNDIGAESVGAVAVC